jgi:hypothetical protein
MFDAMSQEELQIVYVAGGILCVFLVAAAPELLFGVIIVGFAASAFWPLTLEFSQVRLDSDCDQVTVTAFAGLITHVDMQLCNGEKFTFAEKEFQHTSKAVNEGE